MIPRLHDKHYSRDLKSAIIFSLSVVVLVFIFFPKLNDKKEKIYIPSEIFSVEDIPSTVQTQAPQYKNFQIPEIPEIKFPDISLRIEILHDVLVGSNNKAQNNTVNTGPLNNKQVSGDNLAFQPRQIKEVLPEKTGEKVTGDIILSLMIGKDGKVEKYILLANTTDNEECLRNVLNAVYKSRWQASKINGRAEEYWVKKEYNFK